MRQPDPEGAAGSVPGGDSLRGLQTGTGTTIEQSTKRRAWLLFWLITSAVFLADLVSKLVVVATLIEQPPVKLFGGLLYLVHTRNTGAAFSIAQGHTVVLSILAILIVGVVIYLAYRLRDIHWAIALGLIAGGALGNLADRIFRSPGPFQGAVVDFLSILDPVHPPWPVFNLADSALVAGVVLAIWRELRRTAS